METRLVKRNFSMSGLPLLSHFCVFFIIIIGSNFAYKLGFDHERDILRLKSIFVKNCGSRPFGDPKEHGNEAG